MSSTGKISLKKASFTWDIDKFVDVDEYVTKVLESPVFNSNGLNWQVLLYPNGESESCQSYISLTLKLIDCKENFSTNMKVSLINDKNEKCYSRVTGITEFSQTNQSCSFDKFIKRSKLMRGPYIPDKDLTLVFEFFPGYFDSHFEGGSNVSNLFDNEKSSDVTFIVDGDYMYGHSIILKKKSDVFAELIEQNLDHNGKSEIVIDDEAGYVYIEMLRFIYTGQVNEIDEVVHTLVGLSIKYELCDLTDICVNYLSMNVSQEDAIICLLLSSSYKITVLKRSCINFIASNAKVMTEMYDFKSIMKLDKDILFELIRAMALKIG